MTAAGFDRRHGTPGNAFRRICARRSNPGRKAFLSQGGQRRCSPVGHRFVAQRGADRLGKAARSVTTSRPTCARTGWIGPAFHALAPLLAQRHNPTSTRAGTTHARLHPERRAIRRKYERRHDMAIWLAFLVAISVVVGVALVVYSAGVLRTRKARRSGSGREGTPARDASSIASSSLLRGSVLSMPFVTDILGPAAARRRRGVAAHSGRRACGDAPAPSTRIPTNSRGAVADLRARDAAATGVGGVDVLGEIRRQCAAWPATSSTTSRRRRRTAGWMRCGAVVSARASGRRSAGCSPTKSAGQPASSAARRLGRRSAGVGIRHPAHGHFVWGSSRRCQLVSPTGWPGSARVSAPEASLIGYARQHDVIPTGRGPVAPPLAGLA